MKVTYTDDSSSRPSAPNYTTAFLCIQCEPCKPLTPSTTPSTRALSVRQVPRSRLRRANKAEEEIKTWRATSRVVDGANVGPTLAYGAIPDPSTPDLASPRPSSSEFSSSIRFSFFTTRYPILKSHNEPHFLPHSHPSPFFSFPAFSICRAKVICKVEGVVNATRY